MTNLQHLQVQHQASARTCAVEADNADGSCSAERWRREQEQLGPAQHFKHDHDDNGQCHASHAPAPLTRATSGSSGGQHGQLHLRWSQAAPITIGLLLLALPVVIQMPAMLMAWPCTILMPALLQWGLQLLCALPASSAAARARYNRLTFSTSGIVCVNVTLTTTQAAWHIGGVIWFGMVDPQLLPENPLSVHTWLRVVWHVMLMMLVADISSYAYHRLCHENRWLYNNLHYVHHEYIHVQHAVLSGFHVHPIDLLLVNVCFFGGIGLFKTDLAAVFAYGFVSSAIFGANHSGLEPPAWTFLEPAFHNMHHLHPRCNYAEHFTFVDRFFGTFKEYRCTKLAAGNAGNHADTLEATESNASSCSLLHAFLFGEDLPDGRDSGSMVQGEADLHRKATATTRY